MFSPRTVYYSLCLPNESELHKANDINYACAFPAIIRARLCHTVVATINGV